MVNLFLHYGEETGSVGAIHLGVMELEGYGEHCLPPLALVLAPYEEGVIEDAAIHAHGTVNLVLCQGLSADGHTARRQVVVGATLGYLTGET